MLYDLTISGNCEEHGMELMEKMDATLSSMNEHMNTNHYDTGFGFGSRDHSFFFIEKQEVDDIIAYYKNALGDQITYGFSESEEIEEE